MKIRVLLVMVVLLLPTFSFAQSDPTFTSPDRSLTVTYPQGWSVAFQEVGFFNFSSADAIDNFNPERIEAGQAWAQVVLPEAVVARSIPDDLRFVVTVLAQALQTEELEPSDITINGIPGLQIRSASEEFDVLIVGLSFPDGNVYMMAATALGEFDDFAAQFDIMLNSITYTAPEPYTLDDLQPISLANHTELERLLYIPNLVPQGSQWLETWLSDDGGTIILNVNGTAGGPEDSLRAYDTVTGEQRWGFLQDYPEIFIGSTVYDFTSAGDQIVVDADRDDQKYIWYLDINTGEIVTEIPLNADQRLLAAHDDLYVLRTGETLLEVYSTDGLKFEQDIPNLRAAAFSPDGTRMVVLGANFDAGEFDFYLYEVGNLQTAEALVTLTDLPANVSALSLRISPDNNLMAFGTVNGTSNHVLDLNTGELIFSLEAAQLSSDFVSEVSFHALFSFNADSELLVFQANDSVAYFVDLTSGTLIHQEPLEGGNFPEQISISRDGRVMASSNDEQILIWGVRGN